MKHAFKSSKQETLTAAALDMLDFCGGDLSVSDSKRFWIIRDTQHYYNLTNAEKEKVFLIAYSLIEMP